MSDNEDHLLVEEHGVDESYNLGNEEEEILLAGGVIEPKVDETDSRYRASQKERFPTEREKADGEVAAAPNIPDSLDTVVTKAPPYSRGDRGQRRGLQKRSPRGGARRPNFTQYDERNRPPQFNVRSVQNEQRPDYNNRPYVGRPPGPDFFPSRVVRNQAPVDRNFGPSDMRISMDYRPPNAHVHQQQFENRYRAPPPPPQRPHDFVNAGPRGPPFYGRPGSSGFPFEDRRPVQNTFPVNRDHLPLVNAPHNFNQENRPDFIPDRYPNKIVINEGLRNIPPPIESKKVLINPHFKGPVPPHVLGGFEHTQGPFTAPIIPDNKVSLNNHPLSEKELERIAEQFIDGNRRCLERAKAAAEDDDFYEKTQRFIENTTAEIRIPPAQEDKDPKKEYLRRKQEEFINENRLNLRRRRTSPPRPAHRSPPPAAPVNRFRHSPYKKIRPRSPNSPQQIRRESSAEPEDRDYRAKLREQAEMRARILQAKERRRRRDAANLSEKLNHASHEPPPVREASPKQQLKKNNDNIEMRINSSKENIPRDRNITISTAKPCIEEKTTLHIENKKENEVDNSNEKQETLEDMLEDDLLRLSPEDEELLLSDEDDLSLSFSFNDKSKTVTASSKEKLSKSLQNKATPKENPKPSQSSKSSNSLKRSSNDSSDDLRKKLSKPDVATTAQSKENASLPMPIRKKIVFSTDTPKAVPKTQTSNADQSKEPDRSTAIKWKSTFSEPKLDLTTTGAVRAISAVMRNSSETSNRKVIAPKNSKIVISTAAATATKPVVNVDTHEKPSLNNVDKTTSVVTRNVVAATPGRRVVIPPRPQRPVVVIENDEDDHIVAKNAANDDKKTTASVAGLPPGMTEARLLSLCGPEVERVTMTGGAASAADVVFNSPDACQRFIRRFNGRMVAACRLSVTASK